MQFGIWIYLLFTNCLTSVYIVLIFRNDCFLRFFFRLYSWVSLWEVLFVDVILIFLKILIYSFPSSLCFIFFVLILNTFNYVRNTFIIMEERSFRHRIRLTFSGFLKKGSNLKKLPQSKTPKLTFFLLEIISDTL